MSKCDSQSSVDRLSFDLMFIWSATDQTGPKLETVISKQAWISVDKTAGLFKCLKNFHVIQITWSETHHKCIKTGSWFLFVPHFDSSWPFYVDVGNVFSLTYVL